MRVYHLPARVIRDWNRPVREGMALISIQEEAGDPLPLPQWTCPKLILQFSDVITEDRPGCRPIQSSDADAVIEFVETHRPPLLLVHCTMGISRSAAVALALHLLYEAELTEEFWKSTAPNRVVLRRILAAWQRRHHTAFPSIKAGPGECQECPAHDPKTWFSCEPAQLQCGQREEAEGPRKIGGSWLLCPALLSSDEGD